MRGPLEFVPWSAAHKNANILYTCHYYPVTTTSILDSAFLSRQELRVSLFSLSLECWRSHHALAFQSHAVKFRQDNLLFIGKHLKRNIHFPFKPWLFHVFLNFLEGLLAWGKIRAIFLWSHHLVQCSTPRSTDTDQEKEGGLYPHPNTESLPSVFSSFLFSALYVLSRLRTNTTYREVQQKWHANFFSK